jgi:translation initiation factor IF-2
MRNEGIQINVFDGHLQRTAGIIPASALGLANPNPICGLITGAAETILFDERLQEINGMPVPLHHLPVIIVRI